MSRRILSAVALALVAACGDAPSTAPRLMPDVSLGRIPANPGPNPAVADVEFFEVCKYYRGGAGPAVTVTVAVTGTSAPQTFNITLADGECQDVWLHGTTADVVTVTEQVPAGYTASYVREVKTRTTYTVDAEVAGNTASGNVSGNPGEGTVVKLYNTYTPPTGQIGDFVWVDTNRNGIQDSGEPGIAGVTVTLSGAASATTTTNATGGYLFSGLTAGSYTVTVGAGIPAGYLPTANNVGAPNLDSNGSPAAVVLATNSSSDLTIDFGYLPAPEQNDDCDKDRDHKYGKGGRGGKGGDDCDDDDDDEDDDKDRCKKDHKHDKDCDKDGQDDDKDRCKKNHKHDKDCDNDGKGGKYDRDDKDGKDGKDKDGKDKDGKDKDGKGGSNSR